MQDAAPFVQQRNAQTVLHVGVHRFLVGHRAETGYKVEGPENILALLHQMTDQRVVRDQKVVGVEIGGIFDHFAVRQTLGVDDDPLDGGEAGGFKLRAVEQIILQRDDPVQPLFPKGGSERLKIQTLIGETQIWIPGPAAGRHAGEIIRAAPTQVDAELQDLRTVVEAVSGMRQLHGSALKQVEVGLSGLCQHDFAVALPDKKRDSQLRLQGGDVAAHRRLGQGQIFRRLRKVQQPGSLQETRNLSVVHGNASPFGMRLLYRKPRQNATKIRQKGGFFAAMPDYTRQRRM